MTSAAETRYREMTIGDYASMIELMRRSPGVSVREADSEAAIARFLARNPGLSVVAEQHGRLVGCLLAGHDGRRGYLHHLAVDAACRRQGIASALAEHCLAGLERLGIHKVHVDVYRDNVPGNAFWAAVGAMRRDDLHHYSLIRGASPNA